MTALYRRFSGAAQFAGAERGDYRIETGRRKNKVN